MPKCLYFCVNVYITALTGYACAKTKIIDDSPHPTSVRSAFLLKTRAQH